jgi:ribosome-binding protein aMBF1 (putative translation factor)
MLQTRYRGRDIVDEMAGERRRSAFPGFDEVAQRRRALADDLVARRVALGLSQTEVAARMQTSQSAVARLESGDTDVRLSTLERYAAALGQELNLSLRASRKQS